MHDQKLTSLKDTATLNYFSIPNDKETKHY